MWGVVERDKNSCNIKDELKAYKTAILTNLNKKTVGQACRSFQSRLETMNGANGDFFE